jgi:hypothetical protein
MRSDTVQSVSNLVRFLWVCPKSLLGTKAHLDILKIDVDAPNWVIDNLRKRNDIKDG